LVNPLYEFVNTVKLQRVLIIRFDYFDVTINIIQQNTHNIKIAGQDIEQVGMFKYLGEIVNSQGILEMKLTRENYVMQ